uniref:Phosphodiesterase n=1 Tax=Rhodnius prolixus TaxID=13249 RepID=T1HID7_RHOPR
MDYQIFQSNVSSLQIIRPRQKQRKIFNRIEKTNFQVDTSKSLSAETLAEKRDLKLQDFNSIDWGDSELGLKQCLSETFELLKEYTKSSDGTLYIVKGTEIQKVIKTNEGFTHGMKWSIGEGTTLAAYVAFTGKYMCLNKVCNIHRDSKFPLGTAVYERRPLAILCIPAETPFETTLAVFEYVRFESSEYSKAILKFALTMITRMTNALMKKNQRIRIDDWKVQFKEKLLNIFHQYSVAEIDCDKLISDVMILTRDYIKAKQVCYYIPVNKNKKKVYLYEEGITDSDKLFRKVKLACIADDRIVSHVWETGTFIIVAGREQLEQYGIKDELIVSILCVPIGAEDKVLGIAKVVNKHKDDLFTLQDAVEVRRGCIYCALAVKHCNAKEEFRVVEKMFEELKQTYLYFSLGCEHDINIFLETVMKIVLPKDVERYDWYPNNEEREYLAEYAWLMFRNLFKDEPFFKKFSSFLMAVRQGYRHIPYHNFEHAFNVAHTVYVILLNNLDEFTQLEKICMLIAAICHDLDHPGFTNQFLRITSHPIAQLHAESCLEYHHSFVSRVLIDHYQLFAHLSPEERKKCLKEVHDLIIATDLCVFVRKCEELELLLQKDLYDENIHSYDNVHSRFVWSSKIFLYITKNNTLMGELLKRLGIDPPQFMTKENFRSLPKQQVKFLQMMCEQGADLLSKLLPNTRKLYDLYKSAREKWVNVIPQLPFIETHLKEQWAERNKKPTYKCEN